MPAPRYRLFLDAGLAEGAPAPLSPGQAHYLAHVLRLGDGDEVALFNPRDGEWRARIERHGRKDMAARCTELLRKAGPAPPATLVFAPVKGPRLDFLVEKATELGATRLMPVLTRRSAVPKVNQERLYAQATEAAEQCGRLDVPAIEALQRLERALGEWPARERLFFCDEAGADRHLAQAAAGIGNGPAAVLIGPEGGFDPAERALLLSLPFVVPVTLGPRILRAETAAAAALALIAAAREAIR